jgi:hypothetical protein
MLIIKKVLQAHGFEVDFDSKRETVNIYPLNPICLDWTPMKEQFDMLDLTLNERDSALDDFHRTVEATQIMRVIKQTQ